MVMMATGRLRPLRLLEGHDVFHEHPTVAGFSIPAPRQGITERQTLEHVIAELNGQSMPKAVQTIVALK